jgi:hypothetical protein
MRPVGYEASKYNLKKKQFSSSAVTRFRSAVETLTSSCFSLFFFLQALASAVESGSSSQGQSCAPPPPPPPLPNVTGQGAAESGASGGSRAAGSGKGRGVGSRSGRAGGGASSREEAVSATSAWTCGDMQYKKYEEVVTRFYQVAGGKKM